MIKNIPKKIYLQIHRDVDYDDFGKMQEQTEITWNNEKIFNSDIEYCLSIQYKIKILLGTLKNLLKQ